MLPAVLARVDGDPTWPQVDQQFHASTIGQRNRTINQAAAREKPLMPA